jgi:hypothetical protein
MKTLAAALAACVVAGCATQQASNTVSVVRTRPPAHYEATVSDYFDIMGAPAQRRLAFGSPETSDCALHGSGGRHQGWMVPVIYDTTPTAAAGSGKTSGSGTAAAKPAATTVKNGTASATLQEVKISGKGYFFWFSADTIAAVTRRPEGCPP